MDKTQLKIRKNMKQETWKTVVKEVVQAHQVTIVLKLKRNNDKTITRESGILTDMFLNAEDVTGPYDTPMYFLVTDFTNLALQNAYFYSSTVLPQRL